MGLNNFTTSTGVAEFTDVEADSLELPSGYTITEDAGDLVITDTDGTIVLRRIDNGSWSFEGNTVSVGDVEADSINASQLGTSSSPVDVKAATVDATNTVTESLSAGETATESIGSSKVHYAGDFDGGDADTRLDNAISKASSRDVIYLEGADLSADRSISKGLTFIAPGHGNGGNTGGRIADATWTYSNRHTLIGVAFSGSASITANNDFFGTYIRCTGLTVTIDGDRFVVNSCKNAGVTFNSGTSAGIVDSCTNTSVTDNGSNTVGDIT